MVVRNWMIFFTKKYIFVPSIIMSRLIVQKINKIMRSLQFLPYPMIPLSIFTLSNDSVVIDNIEDKEDFVLEAKKSNDSVVIDNIEDKEDFVLEAKKQN
ncbi:hypothetical protein DWZ35_24645 [Bacteroides caccae]|nr:hypothetical protein DWZ35_24645 [Bacteroides caccae]